MTEISTEALLASATEAALRAGALIHEAVDGDVGISYKPEGRNNLVTEMDTASERLIQQFLSDRHPEVKFLAEESGGNEDLEQTTWVVDPIDGTVNYAHGIPIYCVSIAAVSNNVPVVGVIYNPNTRELFTATRGGGAFVNGRAMRVSGNADLNRAVLVTGFPYDVEENPFGCIDAFGSFLKMGIPVRRLGSAALDLAYLAAGRFDGYWEVSLNAWDVAAGALMVTEAGGTVGSYAPDSDQGELVTDRLLATNGLLHQAMYDHLANAAANRTA